MLNTRCNIFLQVEHIVGFVNEGFANSNVKIETYVHCIERYFEPEMQGYYDTFLGYKVRDSLLYIAPPQPWSFIYSMLLKGSTKEIHGSADLVMLLTTRGPCGGGTFNSTS